jgi:hypothetical protein
MVISVKMEELPVHTCNPSHIFCGSGSVNYRLNGSTVVAYSFTLVYHSEFKNYTH